MFLFKEENELRLEEWRQAEPERDVLDVADLDRADGCAVTRAEITVLDDRVVYMLRNVVVAHTEVTIVHVER